MGTKFRRNIFDASLGKAMKVYTLYIQEYWPFSEYLACIRQFSRLGNTCFLDNWHLSGNQLRRSLITALEGLPAQERLHEHLPTRNDLMASLLFIEARSFGQ